MRFVVDMNVSPRLCGVLRERGHEAAHWSSLGPAAASDREILEFASKNGSIVITHDLDFPAILAATGSAGPSVIQVRTQDVLSDRFEQVLLDAIKDFAPDLETGALVVVDEKRARRRVLPLR